jgi:hypothetical protein
MLFSAPTERDLRVEESGVWSGHIQRTSEWNGGALMRGESACGVTNAERWQVALLAGIMALLPLASARICLFLQRWGSSLSRASLCSSRNFVDDFGFGSEAILHVSFFRADAHVCTEHEQARAWGTQVGRKEENNDKGEASRAELSLTICAD